MIKKRFKERIKRSVVWEMPCDELKEIVGKSQTIAEILLHFDLKNKGGNYHTLKRRLKHDNIDFSHIKMGINSNKGRKFPDCMMTKEECLKEVFVENSSWTRGTVKRYLKKYQLIPYECKCGIKDEWQRKKLNLQLDHKNGIDNDDRLENLRWLCPNCHSQTHTFAGKNKLTRCKDKDFHRQFILAWLESDKDKVAIEKTYGINVSL